ncbi:MAG: phosphatase PAP2 family protein [Verrucomicrobiota bacterium]
MELLIRIVQTLGRDVKLTLKAGASQFKKWQKVIWGSLSLIIVMTFFMLPHDAHWLEIVQSVDNDFIHQLSRQLSYWGDFPTGTVIVFAVLFLSGYAFKNEKLRRGAMTCLLAAAIAGILTYSLKLTIGRPRPSAEKPDGAYGLRMDGNYHGFPSGHSATAMGTTTALAVVYPSAAVPILIAGSSVGWSRMMLDRHHPTDVLVGGYLGVISALVIGLGTRKHLESS